MKLPDDHNTLLFPVFIYDIETMENLLEAACIRKLLTFGLDPNFARTSSNGPYSLIHFTVIHGDLETLKLLLTHGADPNHLDRQGCNSLLCALQRRRANFADLLIDFNVNSNNMELMTREYPLQLCVQTQEIRLIEKLLKTGLDMDFGSKTCHGSALQIAIRIGDKDLVSLLLKNKAGVNSQDQHSCYPIDTCFTNSGNWLIPANTRLIILKLLIENGAEMSSALAFPYIPNEFLRIGTPEIYQLLRDKAMKVDIANDNEYNALIMALQNPITDLIRIMVEQDGTDINARNYRNDTILHAAARTIELEKVKLIIHLGANPNRNNARGFSALSLLMLPFTCSDDISTRIEKPSPLKVKEQTHLIQKSSQKFQDSPFKLKIHVKNPKSGMKAHREYNPRC
ncbi:hypothetical protein QAD02_000488 [Eretmocerus hayati]|uniref:Uncharacterized protein n=1 Tax=Eretmocerus hayati TaxID=131215 RepID=A0ACC2NFW4_9HYME|nr:hypothetical protein QAD02_000488 [Eretmocerus hayati]